MGLTESEAIYRLRLKPAAVEAKGDETMRVTALTMIADYQGPDWAIRPIDEMVADEVEYVNAGRFTVLAWPIEGWDGPEAIIRFVDGDGCTIDYLATLEDGDGPADNPL